MDKIHHIAIEVQNIQDSIDWYGKIQTVKYLIKMRHGRC